MKSSTVAVAVLSALSALHAQTDPGPRRGPQGGPPSSGRPLANLAGEEMQAFNQGRGAFTKIDDVRDGLGPRFNLDSCVGCHAHPSPGGTSGPVNPQVMAAAKFGAANTVPDFIQQNGPVRVVRFRRGAGGAPDGGVHNLFVIAGRNDAPSACKIAQPDFSNTNNLSFRIPTPTFGLGLIEAISDATLTANLAANGAQKRQLGIQGRFNTSANDGAITRFGWKAQNPSLLAFSGEAYNVEMGITNYLHTQEREQDSACATGVAPEDGPDPQTGAPPEIDQFTAFMRYLAPPAPSPTSASIDNGRALFDSTGCNLCHTAQLQTGNASSPSLRKQTAALYSDLAIHRMGQALNDGITQGTAGGQDWRTAPLWGLGDRLFLLHDGRTQDLVQAIQVHDSPGSEAHQVIVNYNGLTVAQKQDLLNFLRSL